MSGTGHEAVGISARAATEHGITEGVSKPGGVFSLPLRRGSE